MGNCSCFSMGHGASMHSHTHHIPKSDSSLEQSAKTEDAIRRKWVEDNLMPKRSGRKNVGERLADGLSKVNSSFKEVKCLMSPKHRNGERASSPDGGTVTVSRGSASPSLPSPQGRTLKKVNRLQRQTSTYDEVHKAVNNSIAADPKSIWGIAGLKNLGNTCFLNTAICCLSNCMALTDYFLGYDWHKEINKSNILGFEGVVAEAFGRLINTLWAEEGQHTLSPSEFKSTVGKVMPQFQGFAQHDVQEFVAFLLDAVHEDLNRVDMSARAETTSPPPPPPPSPLAIGIGENGTAGAISRRRSRGSVDGGGGVDEEAVARDAWKGYLTRNKSVIVDLFQGQLRSSLQCRHCLYVSVKFDPFMYLSVPLDLSDVASVDGEQTGAPLTLERCIEVFCEEEFLDGENLWHCPRCKTARPATKKLDLWKMPPVLIIHLKRFDNDAATETRRKLNDTVTYPLENLDLSRFVQSPQRDKPDYDLFAVANHHGTIWGGHYTAYALNRGSGDWHHFDDDIVTPVAPDQVKDSSAAYVLFYHKMITMEVEEEVEETSSETVSEKKGTRRAGLIRRQSVSKPHLWPHQIQVQAEAETSTSPTTSLSPPKKSGTGNGVPAMGSQPWFRSPSSASVERPRASLDKTPTIGSLESVME